MEALDFSLEILGLLILQLLVGPEGVRLSRDELLHPVIGDPLLEAFAKFLEGLVDRTGSGSEVTPEFGDGIACHLDPVAYFTFVILVPDGGLDQVHVIVAGLLGDLALVGRDAFLETGDLVALSLEAGLHVHDVVQVSAEEHEDDGQDGQQDGPGGLVADRAETFPDLVLGLAEPLVDPGIVITGVQGPDAEPLVDPGIVITGVQGPDMVLHGIAHGRSKLLAPEGLDRLDQLVEDSVLDLTLCDEVALHQERLESVQIKIISDQILGDLVQFLLGDSDP